MVLIFPIQIELKRFADSQPFKYLSMLISYGGKKSLSQELKQEGYIIDMDVGNSIFDCWAIFEIEFTLTDMGIERHEFVIKSFYSWMQYILKVYKSPGIWNMMQKIAKYDFYFMHDKPSTGDSSTFAKNMQKYPREYINSADSLILMKNNKAVRLVLEQIKIDNMITLISSQNMYYEQSKVYTKFDKLDEYYKNPYWTAQYSAEKIKELTPPNDELTLRGTGPKLDFIDQSKFFIPSTNKYVPDNMEMVCPDRWFIVRMQPHYTDECSVEAFMTDGNNIQAKLVQSDLLGEMWFKQDRSFLTPLVNIYVRLETDKGNVDVQESTKLFFFESLLGDWILDNLFDAVQASYSFSFSATTNGIQFSISGYNDKISSLMKILLHSFRNLKITQNSFDREKQLFISQLNSEK